MGGGKLGQLGQGRALESCTEPRVVNVAGGTVHKVGGGRQEVEPSPLVSKYFILRQFDDVIYLAYDSVSRCLVPFVRFSLRPLF